MRDAVLGVLVLNGLLAGYIGAGNRCSVELVGAGDLLELSESDAAGQTGPEHDRQWRVLVSARLAVIDDECVRCAAAVPVVLGDLAARGTRRTDALALLLASAQVRDLAERLHLILWHLADRWGHRTPEGVVLALPLTQDMLGALACARRTSVTHALRTLERRGALERRSRTEMVLLTRPVTVVST